MDNAIQVFNFNQNQVRVNVDENGNPWWVARDVCKALGLEQVTRALNSISDNKKAEVTICNVSSNGTAQNRTVLIVNEPGLYNLIFKSRKEEAEAFQEWVYSEVLPSIRKTGSYGTPAIDPATITRTQLAQMIIDSEAKSAALEAQNAKLKPRADFADNVLKEHGEASMLLGNWAKSFDCGIGPKNIFKWMRDNGYLYISDGQNVPKQQFIDNGYFVMRQSVYPYTDSDGVTCKRCSLTPLITIKGQAYFSGKLRKAGFTKHQQTSITVVDGAA